MELQFDLSNEEIIQVLKSDHVKTVFVDRDNNVFIEKGAGQTSAIERIETYYAQLERLDLDILQRQLHGLYANADLTEYKHHNRSGQLVLTPKRNDELTPAEQKEKQATVEAKEKSIEECRRKIYSYEQVLIRYRAGRLALPIDLLETPQAPPSRYDAIEAAKHLAAEQEVYEKRLESWDEKQLYDELFKQKEQLSVLYPKGAGGSGADAWLEMLAFQSSFPNRCIESIRKEIKRREDAKLEADQSEDKLKAATRAANAEAYQLASNYRKEKQSIPFAPIAEQVMKSHFTGLIQRETGNTTRNGEVELTKEWKDKRESIRGTLRDKIRN